jgi:hypothetical protein
MRAAFLLVGAVCLTAVNSASHADRLSNMRKRSVLRGWRNLRYATTRATGPRIITPITLP